jgi:hypothetical protein
LSQKEKRFSTGCGAAATGRAAGHCRGPRRRRRRPQGPMASRTLFTNYFSAVAVEADGPVVEVEDGRLEDVGTHEVQHGRHLLVRCPGRDKRLWSALRDVDALIHASRSRLLGAAAFILAHAPSAECAERKKAAFPTLRGTRAAIPCLAEYAMLQEPFCWLVGTHRMPPRI